MGLDTLDISFRLESEFGLKMPMAHWTELLTECDDRPDVEISALYEYVLAHLQIGDEFKTDLGLNRDLWERLQTAICEVTGKSVDQVQLGSPLQSVFDTPMDTETFEGLETGTNLRMPPQPSDEWRTGILVSVIIAAYCGLVFGPFIYLFVSPSAAVLTPVLIFAVLSTLWVASEHRRAAWRKHPNLKSFYLEIRANNLFRLAHNGSELLHCDDVWERFKSVLIDALGVDDDEVTLQARLVADLGCE